MNWIIPGTTLEMRREDAGQTPLLFQSMFLAGGLTLSQTASITGLEPYTIQNWVKRGFLSPPQHKRYDMEQVCRILNINLLRGTLPLEQVCRLMRYINGDLTREEDDLVDDTALYFTFVNLAARARHIGGNQEWSEAIAQATADYTEPVPGAKQRLTQVLRVMLTAWIAGRLRREAEAMIASLDMEGTVKKGGN